MTTATATMRQISNANECIAIDLPEGYHVLGGNEEGTAFQLENEVLPVSTVIKLYPNGVFASPEAVLKENLENLNIKADETETFFWRRQACALSNYIGNIGQYISGYALAVTLPEKQGMLMVMSWTDPNTFNNGGATFILSTLDSLIIDYGGFYDAGPITTYAYSLSGERTTIELDINGKHIQTSLAKEDKEASEYLIEREYIVLTMYASSKLWQEAWQRYYRMIFKDSFFRMQKPAFDIYNAIAPQCSDETDLAQKLLTWMQNCTYERQKTASDFASLPSMLLGGESDCDSRSLMLAVLLKHMNMDSIFFISREFSHAVAGLISSHPGHGFDVDGKNYLIGETTAKGLTWGMIAQEQDNQKKWIPIVLP